MLNLIAENPFTRLLLLWVLFGLVAAGSFFLVSAISTRQATRRRLAEEGPQASGQVLTGSLRSDRAESAWLKLVNTIEKSGLSLVDSKDQALRQQLSAAGYNAPYAPRVYTLVRLVMVLGLPVLVLGIFWLMGATPGVIRLYF